jgi:16S rRNA G966 N2-methylase RsmD
VEAALSQVVRLGPFDLVLCDPPWKDIAAARAALESLAVAGAFAAGARIVLEHAAKDPPPRSEPSLLAPYDERRWGDTAVLLLEPAGAPAAPQVN